MNEQQELIKELTELWAMRMERLINKKLLTEDPLVVYSAALSMCAQEIVACVLKFEEHQHAAMIGDMGKMITGLYQLKMSELRREQPRIILPH